MSYLTLVLPITLAFGISYIYKIKYYQLSYEESPKRKVRTMLGIMGFILIIGYSFSFFYNLSMALEGWHVIAKKPESVINGFVAPFLFYYGCLLATRAIRYDDKKLIEYMDSFAYDPNPN